MPWNVQHNLTNTSLQFTFTEPISAIRALIGAFIRCSFELLL